jgi:hypothetical protein
MAARALREDVRSLTRCASADVKVAGSGVRMLKNRAFIGGHVREDGKKGRNWMVFRTVRAIHYYGFVAGCGRSVAGPATAAKHLDKGEGLHYKPLQGITG